MIDTGKFSILKPGTVQTEDSSVATAMPGDCILAYHGHENNSVH